MATVENDSLVQQVPHSGQYGNAAIWGPKHPFAKAGVNSGDVLRICRIPAGSRVDRNRLVFGACGASVTLKMGYEPVKAADGPAAVDNYWIAAGLDVSAAGASESAAQPISFDFDVYVTLTIAGANFTGSPKLSVIAQGEAVGTK